MHEMLEICCVLVTGKRCGNLQGFCLHHVVFQNIVGFEIVSVVDETLTQLIWTLGFVFLSVRRSARHSIKVVRLVQDISAVLRGPLPAR